MESGELLTLLQNTGAMLEGHFLLTSGRHSNVYIEKFRVLEHPRALDDVCRAMAETVENQNVELVLGAAIGGIGVDKFRIEEVASGHNIPLYAIVVKESLIEAISVMKKEIAETVDKVLVIVDKLIEERTNEGDRVLLVGVGNTLGVGQ